jgi:RNA polymerase sigma factor (TIGR02999 family)
MVDMEIYQNLRRLAAYYMKMERCNHTLQPTALVHEAYLRVYGGAMPDAISQKQIIATLATAMRHVLVDHARRYRANKRTPNDLSAFSEVDESFRFAADILTIDQALKELAEINPREMQVVELRYFAGMTEEVLNVSRETIKRDWRFARAWLKQRLLSVAGSAVMVTHH